MHLSLWEPVLLRLLLAAILGGVVGLERELHHKPAGIRTSMFICLGSALFTVLSGEIARRFGDPSGTRIVSNLIPGIGFLGAGVILRERGSIVGLTTAATIFVLAAVGMSVGAGVLTLAIATTLLMLVILVPVEWLEKRLSPKTRLLTFRLTTSEAEDALNRIHEVTEDMKLALQRLRTSSRGENAIVEFDGEVTPSQEAKLVARLTGFGWKCEVFPTLTRK